MTAHGTVLCRLLRGPLVGAEVGVHRGETSAQLLRAFPGLTLHMVDPWKEPDPDSAWRATGDPCARPSQEAFDANHAAAIEATTFAGQRRHVWRMTGVDAAAHLPALDFAFLDGDHSEAGCAADIAAYWTLIRPGGLLCGHDYWPRYTARNSHTRGVRRAVDAWAKKAGARLRTAGAGVWWVAR